MLLNFARRTMRAPAFWFAGIFLIAGIATNLDAEQSTLSSPQEEPRTTPEKISREGTRIDSRAVEFRIEGDRLSVQFPDEKGSLISLENLATQRIVKAIMDDPNDKHWVVTGSLTEFQGSNYLLIERVSRVVKP